MAALLLLFFGFVGILPARILLSGGPWSRYHLAMSPFLGWFIVVTVSYYLNAFWLTMSQVFWVLVAIGLMGLTVTVWRRKHVPCWAGDRWIGLSALVALLLFFIAILPHARESSLGLLALNIDEELYYPYAEHLKHSPASMDGVGEGPFLELFKSERFRSRGQGFA